jgi:hypothetical protein
MGDGGKGSAPRPYSVTQEQFGNNWDAIFGKKKKPDYEPDDGPLTDDQLKQIQDSVKQDKK